MVETVVAKVGDVEDYAEVVKLAKQLDSLRSQAARDTCSCSVMAVAVVNRPRSAETEVKPSFDFAGFGDRVAAFHGENHAKWWRFGVAANRLVPIRGEFT